MSGTLKYARCLPSLLASKCIPRTNGVTRCQPQFQLCTQPSASFCTKSHLSDKLRADLDSKVKDDKVVLFMKGNPEEPMCGFSRAVCLVLRMHEVAFKSYDVLQDEELRQGLKEYSNWPTIPQLYIDAEFVGGCDIIVEMHQNKEIVDFFKSHGLQSKYDK